MAGIAVIESHAKRLARKINAALATVRLPFVASTALAHFPPLVAQAAFNPLPPGHRHLAASRRFEDDAERESQREVAPETTARQQLRSVLTAA